MQDSQERLRRLAHVATRYYLEDWKQSDIAKELGVSRPLVSRMLSEARELGVVEITVHTPGQQRQDLTEQLCVRWSLRDVVLCPDAGGDGQTNQTLALAAIDLLERLRARRVGIGWGHFIGQMVTVLEQEPRRHGPVQTICPLLGSAGIPIRNYHSNENVRLLAERLGADPTFSTCPLWPRAGRNGSCSVHTQHYPPDPPTVGADGHRPGEHRQLPLHPGLCLGGPVWRPAPPQPGLRAAAQLLL